MTFPAYRKGREPANKGRKFPPEVLTPEEIYRLMEACGRGPAGRRNRALIAVGARAGLRSAEALDLYPKDVDLERGRIQILHGKGDKRRVVALDPGAAAIVERWAAERRRLGLNGSHPLFCVISEPTKGKRLHDAYVRELMIKLGRKAEIEKRVHFHGLRHSYASFLAERGVPPHHIRRMLGHTSLAVTERYLDHLNPAIVLEQVAAIPWPDPPFGGGVISSREPVSPADSG